MPKNLLVKFIYSEKATKFCEISTVDLTVTTWDKSTVEILQNFVAFSECMNFNREGEIKILSKMVRMGLKIFPQRGRECQTKIKFSGHPLWMTLCVILKMFYDMKFAFHIHKILTVLQRVCTDI